MEISIIKIYEDNTRFIRKSGDNDLFEYWVKYIWNSNIGHAFFHPCGSYEPGSAHDYQRMGLPNIGVETEQREIKNIRKIRIEDAALSFTESAEPGNYHIVGKVINVVIDDDGIKLLYDITVDDCYIAMSTDEAEGMDFDAGDLVEFDLIGLSLYDEGY